MDRNKIITGDCLEILPGIPAESVDLVLTSPPYDDLRTYESSKRFDFSTFMKVADELVRILKSGGIIAWNVNDQIVNGSRTTTSFRQAMHFMNYAGHNKILCHDTIIYEKAGITYPANPPIRYNQAFEFVFILSKGKPKTFNPLMDKVNKYAGNKITGKERQRDGSLIDRQGTLTGKKTPTHSMRSNVWRYPTGWGHSYSSYDGEKIKEHPAVMHQKLAQDLVLSYSNVGDLVLDPFCGSGTTCFVARENSRDFLGIEINPKYAEMARERVRETGRRFGFSLERLEVQDE